MNDKDPSIESVNSPSLEKRVKELEEIVGGNLKGENGLMQVVKQVVTDMYDQVKGYGVQHRISTLEKDKLIFESRAAGAMWAAKIVWAIGGGVLAYICTKIFHI